MRVFVCFVYITLHLLVVSRTKSLVDKYICITKGVKVSITQSYFFAALFIYFTALKFRIERRKIVFFIFLSTFFVKFLLSPLHFGAKIFIIV